MVLLTYLRFAVWILFRAAEILMLLRAVLSFIPIGQSLYDVLFTLTEPMIYPCRLLFEKMGWDAPIPIDLPFLLTFILISAAEAVVM